MPTPNKRSILELPKARLIELARAFCSMLPQTKLKMKFVDVLEELAR